MADTEPKGEGIEAGSYQTSGVNNDVSAGESRPRGGEGSARSGRSDALHPHHFAFKRPVTEHA